MFFIGVVEFAGSVSEGKGWFKAKQGSTLFHSSLGNQAGLIYRLARMEINRRAHK
jgi:hypothetical protein